MAAISQQLADITVLSIVVRILLSTFCAGTLGFASGTIRRRAFGRISS